MIGPILRKVCCHVDTGLKGLEGGMVRAIMKLPLSPRLRGMAASSWGHRTEEWRRKWDSNRKE